MNIFLLFTQKGFKHGGLEFNNRRFKFVGECCNIPATPKIGSGKIYTNLNSNDEFRAGLV